MIYIKARYLDIKELPAREPYPRSFLVSLLIGGDALTLIAADSAVEKLGGVAQFDEVIFEAKARLIDLTQLGGKGKAYRLSIADVVQGEDDE